MRDTRTCSNCGSQEIAGPHRLHADEGRLKINLPGLSTATLEAYSCLNCGFTQFFIDQGGLNNIRNAGRIHNTDSK